MHVFKIVIVFFLLLIAAISVNAQSTNDSTLINQPKADSTTVQPKVTEVNGVKIIDSTTTASTDTVAKADTSKAKKHTAIKALWLSAVCPGLGQAYNKKYWKIPIIYVGFGGLAYALYYTSHNFNEARAAYRAAVRNQTGSYNGYPYADVADIKYFRDTYKNFLNISALVTIVWYGLNLIDAAVDGHLYSYNMDNKLSFNFDPSFMMDNPLGISQTCMGMTFTIKPGSGKHKAMAMSF